MELEWIFIIILFLGMLIYKIIDRYFEYKEKQTKERIDEILNRETSKNN